MSDTDRERMADNLREIAKEGGIRIQRIGQIMGKAFSETATELKQGSTHISPFAKELMAAVGDSLKKKSKEATVKINDALKENNVDSQDIFSRLVTLTKGIANTIDEKLLPPLKEQIRKLDFNLTNRYGDRYGAAKQFLADLGTLREPDEGQTTDAATWRQPTTRMRSQEKDGVTWYEPVEASAETQNPSPFGQSSKGANGKFFTVETTVNQSDAH